METSSIRAGYLNSLPHSDKWLGLVGDVQLVIILTSLD